MKNIKVSPIQIALVAARLWPAIRLLAGALQRQSEGGKRITASELDEILQTLLGSVLELVGDPVDA